MGDYNWFSHQNIEVAADGMRDEAKKWYRFSDDVTAVSSVAQSLNLEASAFAVTDISGVVSTFDLKAGYDKMYEWLNALFQQAATEFEGMGKALVKNAEWYERSDADSAQNFDQIATS
ncbi:MAG: hypothetical protein QOH97_2420 [Actinoplanes sp.]|jgi:hypothetical protein|nr:hypothetical protein [Actinoplanes sp.]